MSEISPLPWQQHGVVVVSNDGDLIAQTNYHGVSSFALARANARYIVLAANLFPDAVASLKELVACFKHDLFDTQLAAKLARAEAVIEKATHHD